MKRFPFCTFRGLISFAFLFGFGCVLAHGATWTGVNLSGGGALTQDTTVTLQNNETVTVSNVISGSGGTLTIAGPGTFVLNAQNTYTKTTYVTGGTATAPVTLRLMKDFTFRTNDGLNLGQYSVLELAYSNSLAYMSGGMVNTLTLAGNDTIVTTAANVHNNIPNMVISGMNNLIQALKGPSGMANFFLTGQISLKDNAQAAFDAEIICTRDTNSSFLVGTEYQSGIFNIGTGATLTVGTSLEGKTSEIRLWDSGNSDAKFIKRGAGTMTVNGTIDGKRSGSAFTMEAGTLNVTTLTLPCVSKMTGGTMNVGNSVVRGNLTVSGGNLNVTSKLEIGGSAKISGGTHNINNMTVWSTGSLELSGGTTTAAQHDGFGALLVSGGTYNLTGGTSSLASAAGNIVVKSGNFTTSKKLTLTLNPAYASATGSMSVQGGTVTLGGDLEVPGTLAVSGGNVTLNGKLILPGTLTVSGGTVTAKNGITGEGTLGVSGTGTLNIASSFGRNQGNISVADGGTLKFSALNAIGHATGGMVNTIYLSNGSTIQNALTDNHSNLGNVVISGTGNVIKGDGTGSGAYGNFMFAGEITLTDGAEAVITSGKSTLRIPEASLYNAKGEFSAGIFNIGNGATLTADITTLCTKDYDGEPTPRLLKRGAGTMNLSGSITDGGKVIIEEGTLNLNGASHSFTGGTTVGSLGILGTGSANGEIGTVTLPGTLTIDGGRIQVDLAGDKCDVFTLQDLILKDGSSFELLWAGDEEDSYAEYYRFLSAASIKDGAGAAITDLGAYLSGPMSAVYQAVVMDGAWTLIRSDLVPEPATWLLLVLGVGVLGVVRRKK